MNKRIPNNSFCLFRIDEGGSRNGKIVLVELYNKQDSESGSRFTVKEYHSKKSMDQNQWTHQSITLKPLSENSEYIDIELDDDELSNLKVVGIFECVLQ
jgi:predicted component of type VI protein secretion system